MLLLALATLAAGPEVRSEPVELKTATGTLHGALDLPPGDGPWPAVLVHPGSGPTDRDGNQPAMRNDSLKQLGRGLAAKGIACLRIDKRAIGASAKAFVKEDDLTVGTYADDAVAWMKFLRDDRRFTRVGFVGHSEGALVGLVAAAKAKPAAFVSLCGPGRRLSDILRDQLKGKLTGDLAEKNEAALKALEAGKTVADVPKELLALYRPSVQPFLISLFGHDPAELAGKLGCPVLVAWGTADVQITEPDAKRLAAARKGAEVLAVENMTHVLKVIKNPKDRGEQLKTYTDPARPIAPEVVDGIARFLGRNLAQTK
jgi:pimeloyl-ACP methyl ester carboxylesterase